VGTVWARAATQDRQGGRNRAGGGPHGWGGGDPGPNGWGGGDPGPNGRGGGDPGPNSSGSDDPGPNNSGSGDPGPNNSGSGDPGPNSSGSGDPGPNSSSSGDPGPHGGAGGPGSPGNGGGAGGSACATPAPIPKAAMASAPARADPANRCLIRMRRVYRRATRTSPGRHLRQLSMPTSLPGECDLNEVLQLAHRPKHVHT
jgi:hypothetical protein